jgi:hypothetical protein
MQSSGSTPSKRNRLPTAAQTNINSNINSDVERQQPDDKNRPSFQERRSAVRHVVSDIIVISELDLWRAANLLIKSHGIDAELEAARLQDLMLDRADDDGRLVWARIRRAIKTLRAPASRRLYWDAEGRLRITARSLSPFPGSPFNSIPAI